MRMLILLLSLSIGSAEVFAEEESTSEPGSAAGSAVNPDEAGDASTRG